MQAVQGESISTSEQHLTVVGAGPKAVAIAAKRRALSELDMVVPQLCVVDPNSVAAHWTGEHGYTDGYSPLGTPPEKDVGFPYATAAYGDRDANQAVDKAMMQYSWMAYRIQHPTQNYADWIDRGKPTPKHRHWADYLRWVADRADIEPQRESIESVSLADDKWRLRFDSGRRIDTDGLVFTSPGPARSRFAVDELSEWVFDGCDFWLKESQTRIRNRSQEIAEKAQVMRACVIGSGETAAAIVVQLARLLPVETPIDVISRGGIVYSRGESHDENRLYSNPESWLAFPAKVRAEFVRRTDRGVFSVANKATLNQTYGVETIAGEVDRIEAARGSLLVHFTDRSPRGYELVVDATGFRSDWFLDLMADDARTRLDDALDDKERPTVEKLTMSIDTDLSVKGLRPALHLPMLAATNQGPGFPNLSCLGLMSDRILQPYTVAPPKAGVDKPDEDLAAADS